MFPNERELRLRFDDFSSSIEALSTQMMTKQKAQNLLVTLGHEGMILYDRSSTPGITRSVHFPALSQSPVDVAGAGDCVLSTFSTFVSRCVSSIEAAALASIAASICVMRLGNKPVTNQSIINEITRLFKA